MYQHRNVLCFINACSYKHDIIIWYNRPSSNQCSYTSFDSRTTLFKESDVRRSSPDTPSDVTNNSIDYSFYVNYPNQTVSIPQRILASLVKFELNAIQLESAMFFSLQTSSAPLDPQPPTTEQSNNIVHIRILDQQRDEVC